MSKVRCIADTKNRRVLVGLDARVTHGENQMSKNVFEQYITDELKEKFSIVVLNKEVLQPPTEKPIEVEIEIDSGPDKAVQEILNAKQKSDDEAYLNATKLTKLSAKQGCRLIDKCDNLETLNKLKIELLGYTGLVTIKKAVDERIATLLSAKDM